MSASNESIANPWNGNNPLTAIWTRTQRLAERGDLDREIAFFDNRARPPRFHQDRFADCLAVTGDKSPQECKASLTERNSLSLPI
jgi:hypothetical protein